jgi:hypothetical protein
VAKGMIELYDDVCNDLDGMNFVEWITDNPLTLCQGMLCNSVA